MMSLGIIYGILTAITIGTSIVFIKRSYSEFPASVAFAFQALFGLILWIPFALYIGVTYESLFWIIGVALISAVISEAFYYYIFSKADVAITSAIFSTYPIFTIFFSFLFLRERLPPEVFVFVFVVIVGIILLSLPSNIGNRTNKKIAIYWGLIGAVVIGFADTLGKGAIDETSAATFLFWLAIMQVPVAIIFLKKQKQSMNQFKYFFSDINKYVYAIIGAFLGTIGVLFFWLTFEVTYASIASPITGVYPVFALLLAYLWLKERLSVLDLIGIGIILVGVFGISTFI